MNETENTDLEFPLDALLPNLGLAFGFVFVCIGAWMPFAPKPLELWITVLMFVGGLAVCGIALYLKKSPPAMLRFTASELHIRDPKNIVPFSDIDYAHLVGVRAGGRVNYVAIKLTPKGKIRRKREAKRKTVSLIPGYDLHFNTQLISIGEGAPIRTLDELIREINARAELARAAP